MSKLNNWYKNLSDGKKALLFYSGLVISLPTISIISLLVGALAT